MTKYKVLMAVSLILAIAGLVLIVINIMSGGSTMLTIAMGLIVVSQILSLFTFRRLKNK